MEKKFMSIPEFVEYSGLGRDYVYERARNGTLPCIQLKAKRMILVEKAMEILEKEASQ